MTAVVRHLGLIGVFALMVPESACIPVPSEVTLLFCGFAVHAGWMSLPLAVIAATAGNVVGSLLAYALGASRALRRTPIAARAIRRSGALLDRHGARAVLIARLLPLARTFVSLPAGARRVPLARFTVLTTIGCALWATAWVLTGVIAGAAWATVSSAVGPVLLGAGLVAIAAWLIRARGHRRGPRRRAARRRRAGARPQPARAPDASTIRRR